MNPNHTPASSSPIGETQEASISEKIKEQALRHMPDGWSSWFKNHKESLSYRRAKQRVAALNSQIATQSEARNQFVMQGAKI